MKYDKSNEKSPLNRREAINTGAKIAALGALGAVAVGTSVNAEQSDMDKYKDPSKYALPRVPMKFDKKRLALVVIDPQVDFLSPKGVGWGAFGASLKEQNTVEHLLSLFKGAKAADIIVAVSPHFYYPTDHKWEFGGPGEHFMHNTGMFDRKGAFTMEGFEGSGADFMPEFKPYILDNKTIIASPHKIFGNQTNDLALQLRKRGVSQILLCGMAANLCVESHLRNLQEEGFEVAVIKDATAGAKLPEGDGYLAALINYRYLASEVLTTKQALKILA
ncbi:isochorismatase [Helicobacter sp. 13S00401-1]|uniref:cysteine hydrolase family protein n=1 Tax=Helicobacter sp. 13S00401-1 TaxID=1905758 RepID=UPI000BA754B9|nr:cysteine hydrolase [Helicobacter sp. 13S00401-1]PAF50732.1 isochorismatase [Helicobacter sp. 13S00401-1]